MDKKEIGEFKKKESKREKNHAKTEALEKWKKSRTGTHSKSIAKKLGIKLYK